MLLVAHMYGTFFQIFLFFQPVFVVWYIVRYITINNNCIACVTLATWKQHSRTGRDDFQDQPTHTEAPKPPHGWTWHSWVSYLF